MDDKSVFNNNPPQNNPQDNNPGTQNAPGDQQNLTLNDLYGPSNPQDLAQAQPPPQAPPPAGTQEAPAYQEQMAAGQAQPVQQTSAEQYPQAQAMPQAAQVQASNTTEVQVPPPAAPPAPPPFPPTNFPFSLLANPKAKLFLIGGAILFVFVIVVMAFGIGRGGGGNSNQKVTLNYWGLWDDSKIIQPIINDFQREHPNITITYKKESTKQYKERLLTRIDNGSGPDIFTYHNTWVPTIKKILSPLPKEVISTADFEKNYFKVIQTDLTADGAIYGLPQGIDTVSLFINKELFEAAGLNIPQNWDEFSSAAKALTVKDERGRIKTAGAALGTFENINHAPDIVSIIMAQNNVDFNDFRASRDNVIGALTFYLDFTNVVWDDIQNPSLLAFSRGEVAMYFGYSWNVFPIIANNPDLQFEVVPVPSGPEKKATIASYWVNGVSNKSKHQVEAMLFMNYLAQKKVAEKIYTEQSKVRLFGTPYARIDLAETLKDNPIVAPFVQQATFAESSYFSSDTHDPDYNDRMNKYLGDAIRGVIDRTSVESASDTLIQGVEQVRFDFGL